MTQVEVRIVRDAREIARVRRPVHLVDGKAYVRYRRRLWPLASGGEVHLDGHARADGARPAGERGEEDGAVPGSEFEVVPPASIEWDESQWRVVDAPPEERLLVGAGPGTGKTAVACGRVSQLIEQYGLEPSRVWLISFTRTAVQEVRDRIAAYLEDASAAYAVKIATLDSHAWTIHSGFDEEARVLGSYEGEHGPGPAARPAGRGCRRIPGERRALDRGRGAGHRRHARGSGGRAGPEDVLLLRRDGVRGRGPGDLRFRRCEGGRVRGEIEDAARAPVSVEDPCAAARVRSGSAN